MQMKDETTGRFDVHPEAHGYSVRESATGRTLKFSFDRAGVPYDSDGALTIWQNPHCARGFAQKISRLHP